MFWTTVYGLCRKVVFLTLNVLAGKIWFPPGPYLQLALLQGLRSVIWENSPEIQAPQVSGNESEVKRWSMSEICAAFSGGEETTRVQSLSVVPTIREIFLPEEGSLESVQEILIDFAMAATKGYFLTLAFFITLKQVGHAASNARRGASKVTALLANATTTVSKIFLPLRRVKPKGNLIIDVARAVPTVKISKEVATVVSLYSQGRGDGISASPSPRRVVDQPSSPLSRSDANDNNRGKSTKKNVKRRPWVYHVNTNNSGTAGTKPSDTWRQLIEQPAFICGDAKLLYLPSWINIQPEKEPNTDNAHVDTSCATVGKCSDSNGSNNSVVGIEEFD